MRISLGQLEAFYWTDRLGSVSRAARQLNVTQPSVSLRLRELERMLGVALFERHGRHVRVTHHGASLRRHAEQIVSLGHEVERYGRTQASNAPTLIRIGAADIFALTCLTDLLRELERSHPNLTVEVSVGFSRAIWETLERGALDLAFLTNVQLSADFEARELGRVPIAWLASVDYPLLRTRVTPGDLAEHQVITNPAPSHLYSSVHEWFQAEGAWPRRVSTCNTLSVIAHLATEGFGVALLPISMIGLGASGQRLRQIRATPEIPPHRLFAVLRRDASRDANDIVEAAAALVSASLAYE